MEKKKDPIEKAIEEKPLLELLFDGFSVWAIIVSAIALFIFLAIGITMVLILFKSF